MIKELGTMAIVAVLSTNITNHFHTVMGAAQSIAGVYQTAGQFANPDQFMTKVAVHTRNLERVGNQVAQMNIQQEVGPFGVVIATAR